RLLCCAHRPPEPVAAMNAVTPDIERTLRAACDVCFGTAAVWPLIERAYSEPQRFYHTLAHLAELFAHLAPYRAEPLWPAIELAAWAHDAVYATTLPDYADNEPRSAQWLVQVTNAHCTASWLHAHASHVSVASDLVLATQSHRLPETFAADPTLQRAGQIFLDADLAILAAAPDRLREYDRAIAREWAQDPDAPSTSFRIGRKQALEHLREQVPLFRSAEFAPLEPRAQRNLDTLIDFYA
ncbi:TPA: HD domain-containing protein, partial [Burkholderia sola]